MNQHAKCDTTGSFLASAHPCDDASDPAEGRGTSAAIPGEVPGGFFASCAAVSAIDSEIARRNCWRSVNCWVMAACFYFCLVAGGGQITFILDF